MRTVFSVILTIVLSYRLIAAEPGIAAHEPGPICWPCALLGLGILVPDNILFGGGGRECPPGKWVCEISWISGGGQGPFNEDPDRYAVGATTQGEFGIYIPDISKCPSIERGVWVQGVDYTIPANIAAALRIQPYTLRKGNYALQVNGSKGVVIFKK